MIRFGVELTICIVVLALFALAPSSVSAQQNAAIAGNYVGTLGPLSIHLHLKQNAAGRVTGTLDSLDRGAKGIHCARFHFDGQSVSFTIPAVQGMWRGTLAADGSLTGTWIQGDSLPLNFTRDTTVQTEKTFWAFR